MGVTLGFSNSSFDEVVATPPNPRPDNYTILMSVEDSEYTLVQIKYHDCTNYEGLKVMIFKCSREDLDRQKLIDPHFSDSKEFHSPIARFELTEEGCKNGMKLLDFLSGLIK